MKRLILFLSALIAAAPAAGEIYKYVAEDGSVVYTNEKPSPDAQPLDLPNLTIADPPKPAGSATSGGGESGGPESATSAAAADMYGNFAFVSPEEGEHIQGTGNTLSVRLFATRALRSGHRLVVYLDGTRQGDFGSLAVNLEQVPRGEHQVSAEVVDANGQVLSRAGPVTFHMRQHSQLHNNQPLVRPQTNPGGGSN